MGDSYPPFAGFIRTPALAKSFLFTTVYVVGRDFSPTRCSLHIIENVSVVIKDAFNWLFNFQKTGVRVSDVINKVRAARDTTLARCVGKGVRGGRK